MRRLGCLSSLFVGLTTGCSFFSQEEADRSSSNEAVASEDAATPCDLEALRALAPSLAKEDPRARARAAWTGVHDACGDALPSAVNHAFEPPPKEEHAKFSKARLDEKYLALLRAACPEWNEVQQAVTSAPAGGRGMVVFEGCDFARFDVVDKKMVEGTRQPTVVAFALYHWLSEMGLESTHAKTIARSLYVAERRAESAWLAPRSIKLPIGDAPPVGESYLLYVDETGVRQRPTGDAMVDLVDGRLAEETAPEKSFTALQVELERWASLNVMQRETGDEVAKRAVLVVAPADTRFEVIEQLVTHASLAGLDMVGIATESPDAMSVGSLRVALRSQKRQPRWRASHCEVFRRRSTPS